MAKAKPEATTETTADVQSAQPEQAAAEAAQAAQADAAGQAETAPETDGTADADIAQLQAELEAVREELKDAQDKLLRAHAEAQNIRRRAELDVEKAHKFALEKFAGELLAVVDNLERGLESAQQNSGSVEAIREGVEMTLNQFRNVLGKFQISAIDPVGQPFDPNLHQAMSMVESADAAPNTVVHVMQKGYLLHERLLRPAMVVVAKAPAGQTSGVDERA